MTDNMATPLYRLLAYAIARVSRMAYGPTGWLWLRIVELCNYVHT